MPTNNLGCCAVPRTPASPTMPMAKPAARPLRPTLRPAPSWRKLLQMKEKNLNTHQQQWSTTLLRVTSGANQLSLGRPGQVNMFQIMPGQACPCSTSHTMSSGSSVWCACRKLGRLVCSYASFPSIVQSSPTIKNDRLELQKAEHSWPHRAKVTSRSLQAIYNFSSKFKQIGFSPFQTHEACIRICCCLVQLED